MFYYSETKYLYEAEGKKIKAGMKGFVKITFRNEKGAVQLHFSDRNRIPREEIRVALYMASRQGEVREILLKDYVLERGELQFHCILEEHCEDKEDIWFGCRVWDAKKEYTEDSEYLTEIMQYGKESEDNLIRVDFESGKRTDIKLPQEKEFNGHTLKWVELAKGADGERRQKKFTDMLLESDAYGQEEGFAKEEFAEDFFLDEDYVDADGADEREMETLSAADSEEGCQPVRDATLDSNISDDWLKSRQEERSRHQPRQQTMEQQIDLLNEVCARNSFSLPEKKRFCRLDIATESYPTEFGDEIDIFEEKDAEAINDTTCGQTPQAVSGDFGKEGTGVPEEESVSDRNCIWDKIYVTDVKSIGDVNEEWSSFIQNSFLLHGYYNYKHVVATKTLLGVPGNYYDREKKVAEMFGFDSFLSPAELEGYLCGRENYVDEQIETGAFGYYLRQTTAN